jgi:hypothetical protein
MNNNSEIITTLLVVLIVLETLELAEILATEMNKKYCY